MTRYIYKLTPKSPSEWTDSDLDLQSFLKTAQTKYNIPEYALVAICLNGDLCSPEVVYQSTSMKKTKKRG